MAWPLRVDNCYLVGSENDADLTQKLTVGTLATSSTLSTIANDLPKKNDIEKLPTVEEIKELVANLATSTDIQNLGTPITKRDVEDATKAALSGVAQKVDIEDIGMKIKSIKNSVISKKDVEEAAKSALVDTVAMIYVDNLKKSKSSGENLK
ncbi:hypothetical protein BDZ45DRAFT_750980 [Acephala macrosclerotiorum]|nr:hypothetical protein BDZ45DRAFT_750980 [Acephala macrosclerotiorum]